MHTTPPMVMASAPNAGAVQPCTRKIAAVAINVAIVMPETGLAEVPTRPTMRELTVTNRKPKTTTSSEAARLAAHPTYAPGTGLNSRKRNMQQRCSSEPITTTRIDKSSSVRSGLACAAAPGRIVLKPEVSALADGGQGLQQRDQAGGGNRARAHGLDVGRPQIAGSHLLRWESCPDRPGAASALPKK